MTGQFFVKIFVTALLVAGISELGKRSTFAGAILASLPLTSVLALAWLHHETDNSQATSSLAMGIFWMVIPSLAFFPILVVLLKRLEFWTALPLAGLATAGIYAGYAAILARSGIKL